MRVDNNNNTAFGAVKLFPNKAKNPVKAMLHIYSDMPCPHRVVGNTFASGIYFFHDLESQNKYVEKLRKGIPFIETDHVIADLPRVRETIGLVFSKLMVKAGIQ